MKSKAILCIVGALLLFIFRARADLEVSGSVQIRAKADFDGPLAAHGAWVEVGPYGRCWRPAHVGVEWRPYCAGSWVWTDHGWYWASDEPWAWACYHYGHWVYDSHAGWVWLPGVEWAPAWVSWRMSPGHVGWAPLPPPGKVSVAIGAPMFVFVATAHFTGPIRPAGVMINNGALFKESKPLGGMTRGPQQAFVNQGPPVGSIEKATGQSLKPSPIREVAARTRAPSELGKGKSSPGEKNSPHSPEAKPHGGKEAQAEPGGHNSQALKPDHGGGSENGPSWGERGQQRGGFLGGGGGGGGRGGGGRGGGRGK